MMTREPCPSDVSYDEWALVAPYLALLPETAGQRAHPLREVFNGLRYVVKNGIPWRAMPHDLPPWAAPARSRAGGAGPAAAHRPEARRRLARAHERGRRREAPLARRAAEGRGVPQGPEGGVQGEDARLRTAERLVRLIAVFCILSWRVFWMTMMNRAAPDAEPRVALTELATKLLDHLVPDKRPDPSRAEGLSDHLTKIARLGGYLARAGDPPPGNTVIWRGMSRLTDITLGSTVGVRLVGN